MSTYSGQAALKALTLRFTGIFASEAAQSLLLRHIEALRIDTVKSRSVQGCVTFLALWRRLVRDYDEMCYIPALYLANKTKRRNLTESLRPHKGMSASITQYCLFEQWNPLGVERTFADFFQFLTDSAQSLDATASANKTAATGRRANFAGRGEGRSGPGRGAVGGRTPVRGTDRPPFLALTADMPWNPYLGNDQFVFEGDRYVDADETLPEKFGMIDCQLTDHWEYYEGLPYIDERVDRLCEKLERLAQKVGLSPHKRDFEELCPLFGWVTAERIKKTLEATTQFARNTLVLPFRKHFKTRFSAANAPRPESAEPELY
jgi:hypothetical protein